MAEKLVTVENLSKKFCRDLRTSLWYGVKDIASELFGRNNQTQSELRDKEFWAVQNVNFELKRGECLGLIGHNGAGKSTLLKMLNGLIKPDRGRVEMRGRVGALIELGAGFNPILTGRENIYVNGAVLGFTKAEIIRKLDEIIAFAEIGDFIDTPVQYYSSGMKVRLGFAVAAQMEPDVLLIDEVLAVGDVGFRIKCFNVIASLLKTSAIIFVSHNMPQVSRICNKVIHLDKGQIKVSTGDLSVAINSYYESFNDDIRKEAQSEAIEIKSCKIMNASANELITYLDDIIIEVSCLSRKAIKINSIDLTIVDKDLRNIANCYNRTNLEVLSENESFQFRIEIKNNQLSQGHYYVSLTFLSDSESDQMILGQFRNLGKFRTMGSPGITFAAFQLVTNLKILDQRLIVDL